MKMLNENHMLMDWYQCLSVSVFVKDIFKDEKCKILLQVSTNRNISTDFDTKHTCWTQIKQNVILPRIILFFSLDPLQKLFSIIILWISSIKKNLWNSSLSCYIISLILSLGPLQKKLADPYPSSSLPCTHNSQDSRLWVLRLLFLQPSLPLFLNYNRAFPSSGTFLLAADFAWNTMKSSLLWHWALNLQGLHQLHVLSVRNAWCAKPTHLRVSETLWVW